ncbi:BglG family transcription antiterminator LicT [Clostridium fallax]|uniref:Transcriptional antiterminator, BglG family n=1 Tax=Clostridium fallax TaxID=1533 RepID=A0A1M4TPA6_9CLOT|nr:PRD domain-containing protein [Clostridium fallax]SHE46225.1 transcriptional antiterminator, BglG family [Clostridium fallax]SQB22466.1 transcription antiterminator [Clostridium fallax]
MIIEKILNNNVVITIDPKTKKEKILMGSGLGFKKKIGQAIDKEKIEKIFTISDETVVSKFKVLVNEIPVNMLESVDIIVKHAEKVLNHKLDEHIYLSLSDHLAFAVKRLENNILVKNTLLEEIRRVHRAEFQIGLWAIDYINKEFNIELPIDEAGFIAFHIVNATYNDNMKESYIMTNIVKDILNIIRYYYSLEFIEEDLNYDRLLTHLKYFAKRVISDKQHLIADNCFIDLIKDNYNKAYKCSLKIKEYIMKRYEYEIGNDEIVYLTMHIYRVTNNKN